MICPICGTDLGDSAFCDNCGTIVNAETGMQLEEHDTVETESEPTGKRTAIIAIAAIVVVIIVAAIAFAVWPRGSESHGGSGAQSATTQGTSQSGESSAQSQNSAQSSSVDASNSSGQATSSSSSTSSSRNGSAIDPDDLDGNGNPTLHALVERNGTELQSVLQQSGFVWYEQASSWLGKDGRLLSAIDARSNLSMRDIDRLGIGAATSPLIYMVSACGYASPNDAFDALAANVTVESDFANDEALFAIVANSHDNRYLAVVTTTNTNEQTVLLYTELAVEQGLFRDTIGVDAGTTLDEAWETITR